MMLIGKTSGINSTVFFCLLIQGCLGKISAVVNVQVQNQHKYIFNLHEVCFVILDAGQCVCVWWCWEGGGGCLHVVHQISDQALQIQVVTRVQVLCSYARHFTLTRSASHHPDA